MNMCRLGRGRRVRLGFVTLTAGVVAMLQLAGIGLASAEESPTVEVGGQVIDHDTGFPIPSRIHIRDSLGRWHHCASVGGTAATYRREPKHAPGSVEVNTTLSAHPFTANLAPGRYTFRVERGKEYVSLTREIEVGEDTHALEFRLQRWADMAARGWYSGDTHTHRLGSDLHNIILAEELNVALPLNYWVTHGGQLPGTGKKSTQGVLSPSPIEVDSTHVIYPFNTEYEIFAVDGNEHTLGAIFVLNHKTKLDLGVPPVAPVAARARAEGALLDLDKHSWAWSLMLVPVMDVDLFQLANNHHWQTSFGFTKWTLENAPAYMNLDINEDGFTEWGWTDFGFKTYYALLNCGYRMRVSAGTASGVHPVQLGFNRVYVRLPEGFTYDDWMAGLDAGRSFVSNGPLLDVRFDGKDAGHGFTAKAGESVVVPITGTALSSQPLGRIEVVRAGDVIQTIAPTNRATRAGGFETGIDTQVSASRSSWIALRCFEKDPNGRVRFAHTNPVFVDIDGAPQYPKKEETAYLVGRMEAELKRNQDVLDATSVTEYEEALAAFQEKARMAR
jgi:hypothetical protein